MQKHGSATGKREDSIWKQSDINVNNPKQANARAQDLVDDVLTEPNGQVMKNSKGGVDAVSSDGRTIRFNRDNSFQGFREPRK